MQDARLDPGIVQDVDMPIDHAIAAGGTVEVRSEEIDRWVGRGLGACRNQDAASLVLFRQLGDAAVKRTCERACPSTDFAPPRRFCRGHQPCPRYAALVA